MLLSTQPINMDSNHNTTNGNAGPKPFQLPSRAELEERRKQLETNKPVLHFKPKGMAAHNATQSAGNATNSARHQTTQQPGSIASASASATTKPTSSDTQNTRQSTAGGQVATSRPAIVNSKAIPQQKQHQPALNLLSDDDFGFGDDLGDIDLDDSLFDMDDSAGTSQGTSINTPKSTAPTPSSSSTGASTPQTTTAGSGTGDATASALVVPPLFIPKSKSTIVVKPSQRGNPLLQSIRNVPYEYGEIVPDFQVGLTSCIVFLR